MTMYSESLRAFLKPVLPFLDDETVSEIMINSPEDVWIERKGVLVKTEAKFSEEGLLGAARNVAQFMGRMLTDEHPRMDARLPDGSRIHVVLHPVARNGTAICIRKFFKGKMSVDALLKLDALSPPMARVLEAAIRVKLNMVISGGTGSGKTTLLNVISSLIPNDERIVTLEDSAELQLGQEHVVALESRPPDKNGKGGVDLGELLQSALRLRPDRIIVGEVRGAECFHLMQALNTGHGGSLVTTHANTPVDTLRRLESLCLMSTVELPLVAVRAQVAAAISIVATLERLPDGTRRVTEIAEVLPLSERGDYRTQDIFVWTTVGKDADGRVYGYHAPTGIVPRFAAKARALGYSDLTEAFFDPATYHVPPPPQFHSADEQGTRWAPSLKHREKGEEDPPSFKAQWTAWEKKLKESAEAAKKSRPPEPPRAAIPRAATPSAPLAALPKVKVAAAPPPVSQATVTAPIAATPDEDADKTPLPSRNPFKTAGDSTNVNTNVQPPPGRVKR